MNFRDNLRSHPEIAYIYVNIKPEMQTTSDSQNVVKVLSFYLKHTLKPRQLKT